MNQGKDPLLKKLADDLVSKGQALNNDRSSCDFQRTANTPQEKDCVSPSTCVLRQQNGIEEKRDVTIVHFDTLSHRIWSKLTAVIFVFG